MEKKYIASDFLQEDHKYLTFLKKVYRHEFRKNWFSRISTKLFENKEFIAKTWCCSGQIVDNVDIEVRQVPYIWIMRSYLENNFADKIQPIYFYFMENFLEKKDDKIIENFLIWTEIIWEDDPILDALQIYINYETLNKIWLKNKFKITINATWSKKDQEKFREDLSNFYENKKNSLSQESIKNIESNPIKILCSTNEDEKILNENAPVFTKKYLKKETKDHYQKFKEYLELLNIPFEESNFLYCEDQNQTNNIWSFTNEKNEIISFWYRHNAIAKKLWEEKEIWATWFWVYTEKIIEMLKESNLSIKNKDRIDLFFVQLWEEAKKTVLPLSIEARKAWINTVISLWTTSMKEQMLKAQKSDAKFVVMCGIMEARSGVFQVRNQQDWTQSEVKKEDLINYVIENIWKENLDFYCPVDDLTE